MRNLIAASALALAAAAPSIASAEGLSYSAGATVASKYVSSGSAYTKGAAFQPWIEAEYNGAYLGVWGSNLSADLNEGNTWETDVFVGYRNSFAGVSYDVSYTKFFFNKDSSINSDEVALAVSYDFNEQFSLGAKVMVDPSDYRNTGNGRLIAGYNYNDKLSFEAVAGKKSLNAGAAYEYYSVGASYAINDEYAVSLTQIKKSGVNAQRTVLALDYGFSFK
ncbi:TorF family putative porin [Falsigemmobacter intermedius]|uniref:Porin n=1 Tax=Falsigemmobacter intermedius TaxID=1553448 RepID=A0A444M9H0_9RHOB|nr:TorF family putative porin [Falsigemmobacter intermedius]RWY39580.1 hypothetical protein EP867_13665 [Falsigemmobacter intermedius]